jgi:hypothetical protein
MERRLQIFSSGQSVLGWWSEPSTSSISCSAELPRRQRSFRRKPLLSFSSSLAGAVGIVVAVVREFSTLSLIAYPANLPWISLAAVGGGAIDEARHAEASLSVYSAAQIPAKVVAGSAAWHWPLC